VGGFLWDTGARLLGKPSEGVTAQVLHGPQASKVADTGSTQGKTFLLIAVGFTALTWLVGVGLYQWKVKGLQEDATAVYQSLELTEGTPVPANLSKHLALCGIPVTELAVIHRTDQSVNRGEDFRFLPVVGVGWKLDHPVSFVVKIDAQHVLPMAQKEPDWTPRNPREVRLLVRQDGAIPAPAIAAFKKLQAPLTEGAVLLSLVATEQGKPTLPDTSSDLFFMKVFCWGISILNVVLCLGLWLRRRYDLKQAGKL
jgi:hypothetical protein